MSYLTALQVKARYQISARTLGRWVQDDKLSFPRPMIVNRRMLFSEAELLAWEERQRAVTQIGRRRQEIPDARTL
jgi:hypothetical protein